LKGKAILSLIGQGTTEVLISFLRDRTFEEEFFLVIENKQFNQKTGTKDKKLVPVEDIKEIEHVVKTEFVIRYREKQGLDFAERIDRFDSKFVKDIIETFDSVLQIVDEEERELNQFIEQQGVVDSSDDEGETPGETTVAPK